MQPNEILKNQVTWRQTQSGSSSADIELNTYLQIVIENSFFLIPISEVGEVSEMLPIRKYPIHIEGHLGVVNLRGKVIPLISMERFGSQKNGKDTDRIVIVNVKSGPTDFERFALIVDSVKKLSAPYAESGSVMTLGDKPVRVISGIEILESWGIKACLR